jgi:hypothetical protein
MRKLFVALAALAPLASPAAALEQRGMVHVTPPALPHPLPQGVPYVSTETHHPVITLRYGLIDGRRVLFEPATGRTVYILQP